MDFASGFTALSTAYQLTKGLKDIHDQVKVNDVVIELQKIIMDAQEAVRDGRDKLQALEDELKNYKNWDSTASRYRLKDFGASTYAYELIQDHANGEPMHLLCPTCFQNKKRSILQRTGNYSGQTGYECIPCNKQIMLGIYTPQSYTTRSNDGW